MNLLLEYAPVVTAGVAGHFGVDIVQESVLVKMVSDLSEEQIGAILRSGALSPQNLAVLERIRATRKAAAAKKAENDGKAKQQTTA